jgi:hypothetical protein
MDYVFYVSNSSVYMTSIENYKLIRKYNYSEKNKRVMNKQLHSTIKRECVKINKKIHTTLETECNKIEQNIHTALESECNKIVKKIHDVINITKYMII